MNTEALPLLNPNEHAEIERFVDRPLTNDEAQALLHDATIAGAFERWMEEKS